MRKWLAGGGRHVVLRLLAALAALYFQQVTVQASSAAEDAPAASGNPYTAVSEAQVLRAARNVDRIQSLVEQGAVPKKRLEQALRELDDARDEAILSATLYGITRIQDLSPGDAEKMVTAAERRVERERAVVAERQELVEAGVLAKTEIAPQVDELAMREQTLELARGRRVLLDRLMAMVKVEEEFERAKEAALTTRKDPMFRYEGSGQFRMEELKGIDSAYQEQFHTPLPVSAMGQTALHDALGFDHRERVDVALNPDQKEGVWLCALLEHLRIPYIAFRDAVAGSATAPHIHIGPGSLRIRVAATR